MAIAGVSTAYVRTGEEEGHRTTIHFCPACESTVHYAAPTVSVYEGRKHAWVGMPKDLQHLA